MDFSNLPEIQITEEEDGSLTIHWDDKDPRAIAAGINDWTEQDWIDAIEETAQNYIDKHSAQEEV
jgi:hypothetical protein